MLHRNATIIQQRARKYVEVMRAIWKAEIIRCANVIWIIGKCYLLKLAVFDRVQATRRTQNRASNLIKRNLRVFLYLGRLALRCKVKRAQRGIYDPMIGPTLKLQAAVYAKKQDQLRAKEVRRIRDDKCAKMNSKADGIKHMAKQLCKSRAKPPPSRTAPRHRNGRPTKRKLHH